MAETMLKPEDYRFADDESRMFFERFWWGELPREVVEFVDGSRVIAFRLTGPDEGVAFVMEEADRQVTGRRISVSEWDRQYAAMGGTPPGWKLQPPAKRA